MIERAARVPPAEPQPRLEEPWVELGTGAGLDVGWSGRSCIADLGDPALEVGLD